MMSKYRNDNRRNFDSWNTQNNYNENQNFSRLKPWSTALSFYSSSGENNFNSNNSGFRNSNRYMRRSSSAPRTTLEEEKNHWNNNFRPRPNRGYYRSRRVSVSSNYDNSKSRLKDKDDQSMPKLKKFRSIFGPEKTPHSNNSTSKILPRNSKNTSKDFESACKTEKNERNPADKGTDNLELEKDFLPARKNLNESKPGLFKDSLSNYYGESLTELHSNSVDIISTALPVANWAKDSYSFNSLPMYDSSKTVGGDGVSIELFYLCKYCKMFTGGCQIEAHLKSRYHYNRYKDFLRTGEIASDSSSTSSSESSSGDEKGTYGSPKPIQNLNKSYSVDIDPTDIEYSCHQELDYD